MNRNYENYEFEDYFKLTKSLYKGIIDVNTFHDSRAKKSTP